VRRRRDGVYMVKIAVVPAVQRTTVKAWLAVAGYIRATIETKRNAEQRVFPAEPSLQTNKENEEKDWLVEE